MAALSPESNCPANSLIHLFDLDIALAMPEQSGQEIEVSDSSKSNASGNSFPEPEMVTVAALAGSCAVCMGSFQPNTKGKQLTCGHVYHADCIINWLSVRSTCPLCRCKISGPRQSYPATSAV
ncbi:hypothetical protein NMG60_11013467 [Bertholletia excelsa]